MKKLLGLLLLGSSLCLPPARAQSSPTNAVLATVKASLVWDPNAESDIVAYRVFVSGPGTNVTLRVAAPPVGLTNLVWNWPNGVYTARVSAISGVRYNGTYAELESEWSDPLFFFWYGNPPARPARPGIEFAKSSEPVLVPFGK